jgi:transposase
MEHVMGFDRSEVQLLPASIEDYVSEEAPVRFIDAYVSGLNFQELGFTHAIAKKKGRPAYHPATLLKLYLYGYLNRVRSSRRLEAETHRNMEVIWLLQGNLLCRRLDLFGAELVAIDGSKFKPVSNSRNHHTAKQLQKTIKKIEERIDSYLEDLNQSDEQAPVAREEDGNNPLKEKLERVQEYKEELVEKLRALEESGDQEIGGHDPEARQMKISKAPSVGYNVQIAVDEKHHLIAAQEVVQDANDEKQLLPMCQASKEMLAPKIPEAVTDTGYHSFEQLRSNTGKAPNVS